MGLKNKIPFRRIIKLELLPVSYPYTKGRSVLVHLECGHTIKEKYSEAKRKTRKQCEECLNQTSTPLPELSTLERFILQRESLVSSAP